MISAFNNDKSIWQVTYANYNMELQQGNPQYNKDNYNYVIVYIIEKVLPN